MCKRLAAALTAATLAAVLAGGGAGAHPPTTYRVDGVPYFRVASEVAASGVRYSNDGGSTWTATQQQYAAGEADSAGDNGDGPYVGAFRAVQVEEYSNDGGLTWTANLIGGPRGLHQ